MKKKLMIIGAGPFWCERAWFAIVSVWARASSKAEQIFHAGENLRSCGNYHKLFLLPAIQVIMMLIMVSSCSAQGAKERIVSLAPGTTEILFALDLEEQIVGVSTFCNYPQKAKTKEKVGSFSSPNIEKIIMLEPDLIVLTGIEQRYFKSILDSLKIDYIIINPSNIDALLSSIEEIGEATNREQRAGIIRSEIESTIASIGKKISDISTDKRPKVYMEIWHDPIMSPGADSFVNDMIKKAGGINITQDLKRSYSKVTPEKIIFSDPNIIILAYMKTKDWVRENFIKRIGWSRIDAVKNNRIYAEINTDIILRPSPRVKEGLVELYNKFYEK